MHLLTPLAIVRKGVMNILPAAIDRKTRGA